MPKPLLSDESSSSSDSEEKKETSPKASIKKSSSKERPKSAPLPTCGMAKLNKDIMNFQVGKGSTGAIPKSGSYGKIFAKKEYKKEESKKESKHLKSGDAKEKSDQVSSLHGMSEVKTEALDGPIQWSEVERVVKKLLTKDQMEKKKKEKEEALRAMVEANSLRRALKKMAKDKYTFPIKPKSISLTQIKFWCQDVKISMNMDLLREAYSKFAPNEPKPDSSRNTYIELDSLGSFLNKLAEVKEMDPDEMKKKMAKYED